MVTYTFPLTYNVYVDYTIILPSDEVLILCKQGVKRLLDDFDSKESYYLTISDTPFKHSIKMEIRFTERGFLIGVRNTETDITSVTSTAQDKALDKYFPNKTCIYVRLTKGDK